MKQILGRTGGVLLAKTPKPALPAGWVLVQVKYSMISIGTEIAGLKPAPLPEQPGARARLLAYYLGKVARNPHLAATKALEILKNKIKPSNFGAGDNNPEKSDMEDQGWNMGYSACGLVSACGEGVTDLTLGQAVACCGAGWANHAEYIAVPRQMVAPVPEKCSLPAASSATIGAIALQGVRRAAPELGERVAVLGLGLIGQITVQLLKASGCKVIGFDLFEKRVQKALDLGMDLGSANAEELAKLINKASHGHGADKVLITAATASNEPVNQAMALVRPKGSVVLVGTVGLGVDRPAFYRKEVNLLMSTSYGPGRYDADYEIKGRDYPYGYVRWTANRNMAAFLEQIAEGRVNMEPLIDEIVNFNEAPQAYNRLLQNLAEPPLGVVIKYDGEGDPQPLIALRGKGADPKAKNNGEPIKTALVGVGSFALNMLVPRIEALPNLALAGVVSRDAARGGNYARQKGVELFASDVAAMAANPEIGLMVIASRHNRHAGEAMAALSAGKAVFVEKPLAVNWEELAALEELYRGLADPPLLMVGFNRRFAPAMEVLRKELSKRQAPLMMLYRLNGGFISKDHWIQGEDGGGRNIGEACHMYDVFRSLAAAQVTAAQAVAIVPENETRLRNDNFTAIMRYEDGSQGTLVYTASGPKSGLPKERLEIFCDGEAYILDDYKSLTRASDNKILWQGEVDKGHDREFELLGRALAGDGEAPVPVDEMFETTALALYIEDLLHGQIF